MPKKGKDEPTEGAAEAEEEEEQFDDEDIEEMKRKIAEMEAESKRLEQEAAAEDGVGVETNEGGSSSAVDTEAKNDAGADSAGASGTDAKPEGETRQPVANDELSIFVGEVDYGATANELHKHFEPCGGINLITIPVDKYSRQPRGFAYIEFVDKPSMENALLLDDSEFRGRKLKVTAKRTNVSGYNASRGRGRGRGGYRGRGRGGYRGRGRGGYGGYVSKTIKLVMDEINHKKSLTYTHFNQGYRGRGRGGYRGRGRGGFRGRGRGGFGGYGY